jgi:hypothetical protein
MLDRHQERSLIMKPKELREQARRWRSRAPGTDDPTAQALVEAANSFEGLAEANEPTTAAPKTPAEFMHRAYEPKPKV